MVLKFVGVRRLLGDLYRQLILLLRLFRSTESKQSEAGVAARVQGVRLEVEGTPTVVKRLVIIANLRSPNLDRQAQSVLRPVVASQVQIAGFVQTALIG